MIIPLNNVKPTWPAPPIIKKPKPGERPKPSSVHLTPHHQESATDFCSPFNTPFISPMDIMTDPQSYRMTHAQALDFIQEEADRWLRCMEVI